MTVDTLIAALVQQGGFAVLAGVILFFYRKDAKEWIKSQEQTAEAFMSFGEKTATALTQVTETLRLQAVVLQGIDASLRENHLCPVTQVSTELLRQEMREPPAPGRRRADALVRTAIDRMAVAGGSNPLPPEQ